VTHRLARSICLLTADSAALVIAVSVAVVIYAVPVKGQPYSLYLPLLPLIGLFIAGYAVAGLYPGFGLGPVETLRRLSLVTTFGFVLVAAVSFALKLPAIYSRASFGIAFVVSLLVVPLGRAILLHLVRLAPWWSEPVVIVGTGARAAHAVRHIQRAYRQDYRPVAVLSPTAQTADAAIEDVPVIGGLEHAPQLAAAGIRVALLETDRSLNRALVDRLQRDFRHVLLFSEAGGLPVEGLQIRHLGDLVGIEYTNNLLMHRNRVIKRTVDLMVASVALVLAAPIIGCAIALVRLIDGGSAFFIQDREGQDGRRISVLKIRTMRKDAQARLEAHLEERPDLRREWDEKLKLRDDPRLLPVVGRLFRRFSIDELPQILNVLRGDMSLVGPRPFPDYHLQRFSPAFRELRARVAPGITGLWQVTVRSEGSIEDQESFDSYYIRNWSVWMDLYVLSRTVVAVASGRGAY
jgi:Undecaprenyl-phosphate galactose phosphotransferase WbaP